MAWLFCSVVTNTKFWTIRIIYLDDLKYSNHSNSLKFGIRIIRIIRIIRLKKVLYIFFSHRYFVREHFLDQNITMKTLSRHFFFFQKFIDLTSKIRFKVSKICKNEKLIKRFWQFECVYFAKENYFFWKKNILC